MAWRNRDPNAIAAASALGGAIAAATMIGIYQRWRTDDAATSRTIHRSLGLSVEGTHNSSGINAKDGESDNKGSDDDDEENAMVYLDANGTTPVYPKILNAMLPYFTRHFGNPSSSHAVGDAPQAAVQRARRQILGELLGCDVASRNDDAADGSPKVDVPEEADRSGAIINPDSACIFTSCGTESDNMAIHLALQQDKAIRSAEMLPHVVTSNVEHAAIAKCLHVLKDQGRCTVTEVPVQPDGRVTAKDVIAAIQSETVLVTLMLANNESGALQPVKEIAEHCRKQKVLMHTDAAQAAGKVSVRLSDLGHPDMVSLVGHKMGAPKGIACLYVRPGCLEADGSSSTTGLLIGGDQEFGLRAGTENVPYIVGMGEAAELCAKHLTRHKPHLERLRYRLLTRLRDAVGEDMVTVHGPPDPNHRLPNTLSVAFSGGIHSGALLQAVRTRVAASAGATCHAAGSVSTVLQAMKIPQNLARGTLRLSLGPTATAEDIDRAAEVLSAEIIRQRRQVPTFAEEL